MKVGDKFRIVKEPADFLPSLYSGVTFVDGRIFEVKYLFETPEDFKKLANKEFDIVNEYKEIFPAIGYRTEYIIISHIYLISTICCELVVEEKKCTCDIMLLMRIGCQCQGA